MFVILKYVKIIIKGWGDNAVGKRACHIITKTRVQILCTHEKLCMAKSASNSSIGEGDTVMEKEQTFSSMRGPLSRQKAEGSEGEDTKCSPLTTAYMCTHVHISITTYLPVHVYHTQFKKSLSKGLVSSKLSISKTIYYKPYGLHIILLQIKVSY